MCRTVRDFDGVRCERASAKWRFFLFADWYVFLRWRNVAPLLFLFFCSLSFLILKHIKTKNTAHLIIKVYIIGCFLAWRFVLAIVGALWFDRCALLFCLYDLDSLVRWNTRENDSRRNNFILSFTLLQNFALCDRI